MELLNGSCHHDQVRVRFMDHDAPGSVLRRMGALAVRCG